MSEQKARTAMPEGKGTPVIFSKSRLGENTEGFKFNIAHDAEGFKQSVTNHLKYTLARDAGTATPRDWWVCTSLAVRDRIMERFIATMAEHYDKNVRRVYYLSLEYLMGRLLTNNLHNTGLYEKAREALGELGQDLDELAAEEPDMGLGNGGLGRLAACFLDSLATLDLPAVGYGIFYEFGLFRQEFVNGKQVEHPDNWRKYDSPWNIERPEYTYDVPLYGTVDTHFDDLGNPHPYWKNPKVIKGVARDIPICGYGAETVNFLRLWESRASEEFDFSIFNSGGYVEAVGDKVEGERIHKVLYPNDATESGKELRLVQQFFFVSCSLQDIIRRFQKQNREWDHFPDKVAIQLNDTHPAVGVPELMRLLLDVHKLDWDYAWNLCRRTFAYTNHTLLPEALETWSIPLFGRVLPRHLQIVYEINSRFLNKEVEAKWPGDDAKKQELSLIQEGNPKAIRMAYLSVVASHAVNGVAALHTKLLRSRLFPSFDELYPGRFQNKTNGITPRRWLLACNPGLSGLVDEVVGDAWACHLNKLKELERVADDRDFQKRFMAVKRENKIALTNAIREHCGIETTAEAIFDVQIKRLHEYKRQHLNLLHILTLYKRLLDNPDYDITPRLFIFAAKAAPGYDLAKVIIHAINAVGRRINEDTRIDNKLKVAFLPNYSVSLAEKIIPAADLSEQISTAGKEASGTGNMKLALNGALTVGTLDGANVEIQEEVGDENIFIFGNTVDDLHDLREHGYNPYDHYYGNSELRNVVDWLASAYFTPEEPDALKPLRHSLLDGGDPFFVLADYEAYIKAQEEVDRAYRDQGRWSRMAILNTARMGKFSSDRTIDQYAREIWNLEPARIP